MSICNNCNKKFKTKRNYERHISKKIPCHKKLKCSKCFKIFNHKGHYEKHINRKNDCSLDKYKLVQKNIQQELIIRKKDNEILNLKVNKLENKITKLESEVNLLKTIIQKHNIEIKGSHNTINNNSNNPITLNIQVYTNHITPQILKQLEKKAIKIIKEGRSNLPIFDKETEFNYSEDEKVCCQYLEDIIKYIWKNPKLPQNNIIKYFEDTYLKYSGNIDKKNWDKLSYEDMKEYILKTIYKICDKEKISKEEMSRKLKNILMHYKLHPKYEMSKLYFNKTFFNLVKIAIKNTLEII